ncbi:MAG: twin-arginine translocation signal domain-containing protein [Alphaproteobacteria bacterium]|nr:twin-arginine translocation signal domain-containing protein [Alphaproteobacteria bacterium]
MRHPLSRRNFLAGSAALGAASLAPTRRSMGAATALRGLVIMVQFPDVSLRIDQGYVDSRFQSLDAYVQEMSYGAKSLDTKLSGWRMMPDPLSRYAISPVNLQVDKSRVTKLIQDAIDVVDGDYDFSAFDYMAVFMRARFVDYGMVGLCGYPGMLGWQSGVPFKSRSGQQVPGGVAIFTVSAHLGTLFHDCAHVWGGVQDGKRRVPCLYDHDLQVLYPTLDRGWANALINMGFWDPMSCHAYKRDLPPPGISSWTKLRLGWLDGGKVREFGLAESSGEIVLGPLEDGSFETLAVRIPMTDGTFLLVENRQPIGGFDPHLPGSGVLIMRADDKVGECRHGRAPVRLVNADPSHPFLTGAAFDVGGRDAYTSVQDGVEIKVLERLNHARRIAVRRLT